jgi:hypothetical protein
MPAKADKQDRLKIIIARDKNFTFLSNSPELDEG